MTKSNQFLDQAMDTWKKMRLSTKISVVAFAVAILSFIIAVILSPTMEEFFSMNDSEKMSNIQIINVFNLILNIGLIVGVISLIVTAYKKIMDKKTPTIIHAEEGAVVATDSGRAAVAKDGGIIDQSITVSSNDNITLSAEHLRALTAVADHIDASDLPDEQKRHAALLHDNIQTIETDSSKNTRETKDNLVEFLRLAESTKPIARAILDGISLLKSLLG